MEIEGLAAGICAVRLRGAVGTPLSDESTNARGPRGGIFPDMTQTSCYFPVIDNQPWNYTIKGKLQGDPVYLHAVANELAHAFSPVAINAYFGQTKVDVVADGGKAWIRVNTIKNDRLLAEIYEEETDNSILRMGRSLVEAARRNAVDTVTLRLTRLQPVDSIKDTLDALASMGIIVKLGERTTSPPVREKIPLEPTKTVNLDLSMLIALASDLTHGPHRSYHSSALSAQLANETKKSLLQHIHSYSPGQFWTTPEARDRCISIVTKIGGPAEQRRAQALFSNSAEFWTDSRFPPDFISLPVNIYPSNTPTTCAENRPPFFHTLYHALVQVNSRLTAHTVHSLLWGASRGYTTLTANRNSVKAIFNDLVPVDQSVAAIWVVDPKSLTGFDSGTS